MDPHKLVLRYLVKRASRHRVVALLIGGSVLALLGCAESSVELSSEVIARNDRGVSMMGQYQYVDAHTEFTIVTEEAPNWDVGWVNLAIATLNRQDPDDELRTLEILQSVLDRSPNNVRALYSSGIVNLYLGNTTQAIEFLKRAYEIDPNDAFTTYFLGQAHLQAGEYDAAQERLLETLDLNPAIRSAYWAAATASRRLGDIDQATALIEDYQKFEHNPLSVSAGFSYKQMGPKAEAQSMVENVVARTTKPDGTLFTTPETLEIALNGVLSISTHDIDRNGFWDVLLSDGESTVTLSADNDELSIVENSIDPHVASAWGDLNNDGKTELVLCQEKGIAAYTLSGFQVELSEAIANSRCNTLRVYDADHDGDLDVLTGNLDGIKLFHNDASGSFIPFAAGAQLAFDSPVVQVLTEDLDRDRDADLVVVGDQTVNRAYRNELTWRYEDFPGFETFSSQPFTALTSIDVESDGKLELVTGTSEGGLSMWQFSGDSWVPSTLASLEMGIEALDAFDFDGDAGSDLLIVHDDRFSIFDPSTLEVLTTHEMPSGSKVLPIYLTPQAGPGIFVANDQTVSLYRGGLGRYPFLSLALTGKTSADQMRSNASGIGTYVKLRADSRWSLTSTYSRASGSSQSLMPLMFGSGGATQADYIELTWSDGVSQTETGLDFGEMHAIEEVQRQLASCPVVFVWNGEKYEFVSDVLGVAALGYFASPGVTTPVRTKERLLLPEGVLIPRDGRFEVKIGEPMEEILYLDSATLMHFDVPMSWNMTLDERLNVQSSTPSSEPIYFQTVFSPIAAHTNLNSDALPAIVQQDKVAVDPGPVDSRFIGLLADELLLTLEFDRPLPRTDAVLVADGWVEFPYSQTSFGAYQVDQPYIAPTLEARDANGDWHTVIEQFGYPGGMPRQMSLPLPTLTEGTTALRLRSNLEIYWDRIQVVKAEYPASVMAQSLEPSSAQVKATGYAKRTTGPQRVPYYDYDDRQTHGDAKHATGYYTAMGDATELVTETDGAVAIIGSGEEVHLTFEVPEAPAPGFRRYFVLEFQGWAKDMDLYTTTGDTVNPVPQLQNLSENELVLRDRLHDRYNVRHQSGMAAR